MACTAVICWSGQKDTSRSKPDASQTQYKGSRSGSPMRAFVHILLLITRCVQHGCEAPSETDANLQQKNEKTTITKKL